jgi:threonine/homoserine/homoserine lactone efflux protein
MFPVETKLFVAFVATGLALNVTPGPDMLFVLASGMKGGRSAGLRAALGIGAGSCVHTAAAAVGLSTVLAASALLFGLVKFVGAAYLVYLGVRALARRSASSALIRSQPDDADARVFRRAMVTNILNPKVALFFLALVPQFVSPTRGHVALQFLFLGMVFNLTGTCVNALVGGFAGEIGQRLSTNERLRLALDRVTGMIFIALGIRLALTER